MEKVLNYIGLGALITSIFLFGLKGMHLEMGLAIVGSAFFLVFVNINKFSKFKGAGFSAELRQKVNEAYLTIENLKKLAVPLIETNYNILANANRIPESAFKKNHEIFDKLVELQSDLKLKFKRLEASKSYYLNNHAWDMVKDLSHDIDNNGVKGFNEIIKKEIGERDIETLPDLDNFLKLLSNLELNETQYSKLKILKDYNAKYLA